MHPGQPLTAPTALTGATAVCNAVPILEMGGGTHVEFKLFLSENIPLKCSGPGYSNKEIGFFEALSGI